MSIAISLLRAAVGKGYIFWGGLRQTSASLIEALYGPASAPGTPI